ncbi:FAD-dependent monooxygenase [Verrucomicrobium sp. BvORR106]|uniref:FAD-dependent monooxygenase n=1 Tax=Verrucomicrobium sp. BvORR106 TaxID=1403819 RepID=UPI0009E034D5|nr:FAD-dependent monooxygenase [Verrucomicrobium sp. BvORR106]
MSRQPAGRKARPCLLSPAVPAVPPPLYSRTQQWVALAYGIACHSLFAASVVVMFVSLYTGLTSGLLQLHGWKAVLMDGVLLLQFAAAHSLLLGGRGRKILSTLAPLGLGRDLATTIFAGIASLQLLLTFLLWSPTGVVWAAPHGMLKSLLTVAYVISWILLARSMHDAGLDVQIGSLGWRSIWRNQRPIYQPFARTGMFRYSRQPIYSSFTLILWTAPVWTPDHAGLALLWTLYCVAAPVMKERRYRRYYGEAFARYQQNVPYWFPRILPAPMCPPSPHPPSAGDAGTPAPLTASVSVAGTRACDIAIVGAGPVGLLLANLLGPTGLRVVVLEKSPAPPSHSRAIGITPPSLEILSQAGLADAFVVRGVKIQDVQVHGVNGLAGICSFRELPGRHPYILSVPQQVTMALLEQNLRQFSNVTLHRNREVTGLSQSEPGVVALQGGDFQLRAAFTVACDGWRSSIRQHLKIRTREKQYGCHFVMGDFADRSGLGEGAHLFFTPEGAVESFPLPSGIRRWIVQTPGPLLVIPRGFISQIVQQRAGIVLDRTDQLNQSAFTPHRKDCEVLYDHRVILCGDAAHAMSPIGGQGMNVGFADAEMLSALLPQMLSGGQDARSLLEAYQRHRQRAARLAADRAAQGMWLGTWTGLPASWLRDAILGGVLLRGPFARLMGSRFAMMDVPRGIMAK